MMDRDKIEARLTRSLRRFAAECCAVEISDEDIVALAPRLSVCAAYMAMAAGEVARGTSLESSTRGEIVRLVGRMLDEIVLASLELDGGAQ